MLRLIVCFLIVGITFVYSALAASPEWSAFWIDVPDSAPDDYGVYHFRRGFDLPAKPDQFTVRVSGDNRYQLFVNGEVVSRGPARGDLTHWRFETVDIAPQLRAGHNVLAAVVWNDGPGRAIAQISNQTGFLLQADTPENQSVNTGRNWRCLRDLAYAPLPLPAEQNTGYYALSPNEKFDAALFPWGWEQTGFDDGSWKPAHEISKAASRDARDAPNRWMLVPSQIPLEEIAPEKPLLVRDPSNIVLPLTIPPHTNKSILLDQGRLTTAYPEATVSGGKGATLALRYAESLYRSKRPIDKGNRNEVEGKQVYGPADLYFLDGAADRTFRPLFWRTYRYFRLEIATADEPLTIQAVRGTFTAYPFQQKAQFDTGSDSELQQILATGWHTARLCAHESYMDCPYYEQLQYAGDARIQMMVSLFVTGDSRLMKNGIGLLDSSRTAEGATFSRAPSRLQQYIPGFSLWWIGMLHDYWWYVNDPDFVRQMLPGVRAVLSFFAAHQKPNGSLGPMPWWNYVDWVREWPNGEAPAEADGSSAAACDLQLLLAYDWAADLEDALGNRALSQQDRASAAQLRRTIVETDWDSARGLFADQPSHRTWSQQVNTLAVLAHLVEREKARTVVEKIFSDRTLARSSIYFRAYTNATLREVGLGDRYLDQLGPWRHMLSQGLTTLAEVDDSDSRSDCHAWGASPNYEVLRTIAGIDSAAPGFARVLVRPNLGALTHLKASVPHPSGSIEVEFSLESGQLRSRVELPPGVSGEFEWHGRKRALRAGRNEWSQN